ncbi:hypothetical protein IWX90DRAFT_413718 [Phyllosticta citrichinensis]|uniref:DUF6604 domain-containing protein n=1 Tax=Phyllosticta citrichinensis TaxID=1130410 RepID=A0ABR1XV25_9PEZI
MGPTAPSADKDHSSTLTKSLAGLALKEPPTESEPEFKADQFEDPNELYLAFKLLVEGVHKIWKVVGQIWAGSVAAALATNTAINFARQLEQDFSGVLEKYGGFEKIYKGWWSAVCRSYGYDVYHSEKPGDDMNFLAYDDADIVMFPTYLLLTSLFLVVQDDLEMILICKPGHLGKVDYFSDWNSKAPWKKYQSDKALLLEVLGSLTAVIRLAGDKKKGVLAEDAFIRGLRIAIET